MTKKTTKPVKYADGINKSESEIEQDQKEFRVAEAKNILEMGTLDVKGKMIAAQSAVKSRQQKIDAATRKLELAKFATPFDVNAILQARAAIKQATLDMESDVDVFNQYEEAFKYLTELNSELF